MSQMVFDEGLAARLDAMYRTRDMVRRRRLARAALGVEPGEHVVDVGCGPGFYVAELLGEAAAALAGMHRALRPGGRLVVWDIDWSTVSWQSRDPARMERRGRRARVGGGAAPARRGRRVLLLLHPVLLHGCEPEINGCLVSAGGQGR